MFVRLAENVATHMSGDDELDDGIEPEDDDIPVTVSAENEDADSEVDPWAPDPVPPVVTLEPSETADRIARSVLPVEARPSEQLALPDIAPPLSEPRRPHLLVIAAGRGGAGKSLLAANVAVYLAQMGKRVVTVDADPAGGTLNFMLGTPRPVRGFGSFLRGRNESLDELAIDTPVAGVRLVAGEAHPFGTARSKVSSRSVLEALRGLAADYIVVDLGAPDSQLGLDLWLAADTPLVVTLTDPASIESTYRFLKSGFLRRLRAERGMEKHLSHFASPLPAALDLYRAAVLAGRSGRDDASVPTSPDDQEARSASSARPPARVSGIASTIAEAIAAFRPRLIVAQTRSTGDTKVGPQMAMAVRRRLGHAMEYVGHIETDETVAAAARRRRPVMAEFPEAKICKNIEKIVRRLLSTESERPHPSPAPRLEDDQTYYELLETEPGVSDEEVRRAYRLFKEVYASTSPVISGLYEDAELAALHTRAAAAHDALFAPERRRQYDLSLPEADLARAVRRAAQTTRHAPNRLPVAEVDEPFSAPVAEDGEITGSFLRKIREQRGLELSDIAQRTRISERHLRSIEDERFDELPAAVYVRGFVGQVARILKLDHGRAVEQYLRRFHGANGPGIGTPDLRET